MQNYNLTATSKRCTSVNAYRYFDKKEKDFIPFVNKLDRNLKDDDAKEVERICCLSYEDLELDKGKGKRKLDTKASVAVNHSPNNLNYWHFTVDCYPVEDKNRSISGIKGWRNIIAVHLKNILENIFIPIEPDNFCFGIDYKTLT